MDMSRTSRCLSGSRKSRAVQASCALLSLLAACGDAAPGSLEQGQGASAALCAFDPLFEPRALGADGSDSVRHIAFDGTHGELLFSGYLELFQVGGQGGEPHKLGDLLGSLNGEFWLAGEQILVPGGVLALPQQEATPVLLAMPRVGGALGSVVTLPAPRAAGAQQSVRDVRVLGDEVYWLGVDALDEGQGSGRSYTIRKTSWRSPAAPVELYRSADELRGLLVSDAHLVFSEQSGEPTSERFTQKRMPREGGQARDNADLGGEVRASFGGSLLVERADFFDSTRAGLFRVSEEDREGEPLVQGYGYLAAVHADEQGFVAAWIPTNLGNDAPTRVLALESQGHARQVGCVDVRGSIQGLGASADTVYVALHDAEGTSEANTILRFAR